MTRLKKERILLNASIFYGAFPASPYTANHKIILKSCELIKRISEYQGSTAGKNALPMALLDMRYTEFWEKLQELEESLERGATAYKEARKSLDDLELFLNSIFCHT